MSLAFALGVAATTRAQSDADPDQERVFDPGKNLGPDGTTVIKPELPPELPNPERWRYTPGGRIKPGSIFERFLVSTWITPLFFREEDIGFGGGIAFTDLDFRNQDWQEFANIVATASAEGQQTYSFAWRRWLEHQTVPEGGIIRDERSTLSAGFEYSRTLTRRFFGFDSKTRASDETSYTEELARLRIALLRSFPDPGDDWIYGLRARVEHHGLERGQVERVPSTNDVYRAIFREGDGVQQLWFGAGIAYDSRDSLANPYEGLRVGLNVDAAAMQSGFDPSMIVSVDASTAIRVPPLIHDGGSDDEDNPPTDVIAFGAFGRATYGELPWYSLPTLGGEETLRGYIQRRFTGKAVVHGSAEYRFAIIPRGVRITDTIRIERIGAALFYDFGTVASSVGRLGNGRFLGSYGLGLRIGFQREAVFRVDFGISDEDRLLTIAFGNTF
ncbi:MAG: BamA/TamA family outer membrane protein [Planctomycetes bacterium]|nr:BamA/TamA family outer membrane protein [Planctomycetota bacterium]